MDDVKKQENDHIFQIAHSSMDITFLKEIESAYLKIVDERDETLKEHEEEWKKIPEDRIDRDGSPVKDLFEGMLGDEAYINSEVEQILSRSFIMTICMTLEYKLSELCHYLQKEYQEKITLEDFSGEKGGIMKRIKYIEILTGENLLKNCKDLQLLIELRNIIAHNNGMISSKKQKNIRSRFNKSCLRFDFFDNRIFIDRSFLQNYLNFTHTLMKEIFRLWQPKVILTKNPS